MLNRDESFWEELARCRWRRVKWRRTTGEDRSETCVVYGTPIHRKGTYYLRPAYTDGERWLSQRAYEEMVRITTGSPPSRRYGRRGRGRARRDD